jgi:SMODS and SLOG-associating 2TM effector domain 3
MFGDSTLPLFRVVGFSGHRQLDDPAGAARAIAEALALLRHEVPGDWIGLSSVASGSDQLFVEQVLSLGLSWHAILPLPVREFKEDFSPSEWVEVERQLTRAGHVLVINENGSREDGYLDCGMETVAGADVLIAVWDGEPARGKGGTADVVEYAKSIGKPMLILDAATLAVRTENWTSLDRGNAALTDLNRLPDASTGSGENPFKAPDNIYRFQRKCDAAASHGAPQSRRLIVSTVLLHVVATIIAAAVLAYDLQYQMLPWAKLLCLAGALGVALVLGHRAHSHSSWVRCRLAAEFCRSALATWGLPQAAPLFQDLNLPNIRGLTRSLHILHSRSQAARPVSMSDFKNIYIAHRIDDQLAYYQRQEARALPLFTRLKIGFWIATIFALLCTLAYALSYTLRIESPQWMQSSVFHFLPIALPVVAAAFISMISINDLQRRVSRYREMKLMLMDSRKQVAFSQTWNSLERIVLRTEHALLQEVLEWHSITSFGESH